MPIDAAKIAQMEKELAEAKAQLLQEHGKRYEILMREISEEERQRILDGLTEKHERILFGLDLPDEPRRRGTGTDRPGKSGGDLVCSVCGKGGLTKRGLALHMVRMHKGESAGEPEEEGVAQAPISRAL